MIPSWPNRSRTVAAFSARLPDEIDLDSLFTGLLTFVDQTMQRQGRPSGRDHRLTLQRVVKGEEASDPW